MKSESEQNQMIEELTEIRDCMYEFIERTWDIFKNYFENYCKDAANTSNDIKEDKKMKSETHKFKYNGEPVSLKTVVVYDTIIAELMAREGYVYLQHEYGDPVEFIGDIAVKEASGLQKLLNTSVPVDLTFRDLCVLTTMIDENCTEHYERFGIMDCKRKLCEGIKKIDNEMSKREN